MKKYCVFLIPFLIAGVSYGQTEQGSFLINAKSDLSALELSITDQEDKFYGFAAGVGGAFFVIDQLALGMNLNAQFTQEISNTSVNTTVRNRTTTVTLFGRYYAMRVFFIGVNYGFNNTQLDVGNGNIPGKSTVFGLEFGQALFITDHVAIEPSLQYNTYRGDADGLSSLAVNISFNLFL